MTKQQWCDLCTPDSIVMYGVRPQIGCPVPVVDMEAHINTPFGLYTLECVVGQNILEVKGLVAVSKQLIHWAKNISYEHYIKIK